MADRLKRMNLPLFLARRIDSAKEEKRKVSQPAVRIATAGVAVGLAVMLISVSVVFGFKHTVQSKVVGFGSHIQVLNFRSLQAQESFPVEMNDSMMQVLKGIKGVQHVQRFALKQGLLKTDSDFLGVMFKGIGQEYDTAFISQNMLEGAIPRFSDKEAKNQILLSKRMADKLKISAGEKVFAYFIGQEGVRARRFKVSGVYQTNLSQYDNVMVYTDIYTAVRLNGWQNGQASGAEVAVNDFNKLQETEDVMVDKVNKTTDNNGETYTTRTIQEINPDIFHWLDLLDMNVWLILILMLCVAGVTMISGLLIIILERTAMIGTLKALGAKGITIRKTFLWVAVFIIGKGMAWGNLIGIGLIMLQQITGIARLNPTTYYVSTVPVELNFWAIMLLNALTLTVSIVVLVGPSYLISHIHPAKSMRYE